MLRLKNHLLSNSCGSSVMSHNSRLDAERNFYHIKRSIKFIQVQVPILHIGRMQFTKPDCKRFHLQALQVKDIDLILLYIEFIRYG